MNVIQLLFDYSVKADRSKLGGRIGGALARRVLRRAGFRTTIVSVDGVLIDFPVTHGQPHLWARNPNNSKCLGRVARAVALKYPESLMIDVGANIGDSSAIIRSAGVENRILAIEGVNQFYAVLHTNAVKLGNIDTVNCFVGTKSEIASPSVKVMASGNAVVGMINKEKNKDNQEPEIEFSSLTGIVENRAPDTTVKLIKTDIEGFDIPVIDSSIDLITSHRPVIFMELHVSDGDEVNTQVSWKSLFAALQTAGYDRAFYWHNSDDLMALVRLDDTEGLEVLNQFYRNRHGHMYADVCIVHAQDSEISSAILTAELANARSMRPS